MSKINVRLCLADGFHPIFKIKEVKINYDSKI